MKVCVWIRVECTRVRGLKVRIAEVERNRNRRVRAYVGNTYESVCEGERGRIHVCTRAEI